MKILPPDQGHPRGMEIGCGGEVSVRTGEHLDSQRRWASGHARAGQLEYVN